MWECLSQSGGTLYVKQDRTGFKSYSFLSAAKLFISSLQYVPLYRLFEIKANWIMHHRIKMVLFLSYGKFKTQPKAFCFPPSLLFFFLLHIYVFYNEPATGWTRKVELAESSSNQVVVVKLKLLTLREVMDVGNSFKHPSHDWLRQHSLQTTILRIQILRPFLCTPEKCSYTRTL